MRRRAVTLTTREVAHAVKFRENFKLRSRSLADDGGRGRLLESVKGIAV